jgi:hypothetical protein
LKMEDLQDGSFTLTSFCRETVKNGAVSPAGAFGSLR